MIICRECNAARREFPDRWWIEAKAGQCGYCQATKPETINVLTKEEAIDAANRGKGDRP